MQTRTRSGKIRHEPGMYYEKPLNASPKIKNRMEMDINENEEFVLREEFLVLSPGCNTFFGMYKGSISSILLSKGDLIALKVRGFDVHHKLNKIEKYVRCDVKRDNGIKRNQLINQNNLYREDYIHAIDGNEEELLNIGFLAPSEVHEYRKKDAYGILKYKEGDEVYQIPLIFCNHNNTNNCLCVAKRRCIKGVIGRRLPSQYWGALTPTYEFLPASEEDAEWKGYVYEIQICKDNIFREIGLNDIIIDEIRTCIASSSDQYICSPYLDGQILPLDIIKTSALFGKPEMVECYRELLDDASYIISKCQCYSYLRQALKKIFKQKVDKGASSVQIVRTSAIGNSVLTFGIYCDAFMSEATLKYLIEDNIDLDFLFKTIKFELSIEFIMESLNVSNIILKRKNDSEIRLKADRMIKFGYHRKHSFFSVESFAYYPANADVVRVQQQQNQMNID